MSDEFWEVDQAIADMTAHTAFKTPTKVAEFLVERVQSADRRLVKKVQAQLDWVNLYI